MWGREKNIKQGERRTCVLKRCVFDRFYRCIFCERFVTFAFLVLEKKAQLLRSFSRLTLLVFLSIFQEKW